jgi:hypothetical protein
MEGTKPFKIGFYYGPSKPYDPNDYLGSNAYQNMVKRGQRQ